MLEAGALQFRTMSRHGVPMPPVVPDCSMNYDAVGVVRLARRYLPTRSTLNPRDRMFCKVAA